MQTNVSIAKAKIYRQCVDVVRSHLPEYKPLRFTFTVLSVSSYFSSLLFLAGCFMLGCVLLKILNEHLTIAPQT